MILMPRRRFIQLAAPAVILPSLATRRARAALFATLPTSGNPWSAIDGSLNAPSGTPQLPTLLNGYPLASPPSARTMWPNNGSQSPWHVAGVDYYVGIDRTLYPTNGNLKDPATISIGGVTVNSTTKLVTVNSTNVTLDGYDFSLANGWAVIQGLSGGGLVISNSYFLNGSNAWSQNNGAAVQGNASATGITITKCILDGNGALGQTGFGILQGMCNNGPNIITYNYIANAWAELITAGGSGSSFALTVKYNLLQDAGRGTTSGAHGDWMQLYLTGAGGKTASPYGSSDVEFNTCYQTYNFSVTGSSAQGWSIASANIDQCPLLSSVCDYNTMICLSVANVNAFFVMDSGNNGGTATLRNNYIDLGGVAALKSYGAVNGAGPGHGNQTTGVFTETGNISMRDGTTVT